MAEAGGKKFSRSYVQWTPKMDSALLDVFVEHHNNGDHAQNGWKPHVYHNAIKAVREKCGVDVTKEKIVSRCKTFDKDYEILSKILAQSGFGWDWENKVLLMDSDEVWDKYVEANEKAAIYKNKVIHNWHEICIVYSKDKANGEGAMTGNETEVDATAQENDMSPGIVEPAPKRQRASEALLCMVGEMKTSFNDALKTTQPLTIPQGPPTSEMLHLI
ncbi:uncharacterized protein LOC106866692 [Brachypodium distachyon]|uniref:uncharacterized protein LOC106866692 n=1 Tax=Brachypodium distachyon TaxID=15368 RepID=UPI00071D91DA|nr:uncharacterized protein LOC106866692 [Brachypodium distachyon]|eukprot:XP_014757810.1 uncharacterized protein LOC106866692 [Brachypodium distachyon]